MPSASSSSVHPWWRPWLHDLRDLFVSLRLTIVLLLLSTVLIFAATLDQVNLGIWAVQEKYFRSFVVYKTLAGIPLPVFPGGYAIGGLLLLNLLVAHIYRFAFTWRRAGILLTHLGLILLLVGELLTGLWQRDYHLRLNEGETKNYAESFQYYELAVVDVTDEAFDAVVAIPDGVLSRKVPVQHPQLPFRVVVKSYYPNSTLLLRPANAPATDGTPQANAGVGDQIAVTPRPITYRQDERNVPSSIVELVGPDTSLGTYLVSGHLSAPQQLEAGGRTWRIALRPQRAYQPFSFTLLKFSHDRYAGTEIPKNFSSRVRLTTPDGREDREVLIHMNNPLREAGFTFYQAGFENNDRTSILQVVRNPSWTMPYIACALMTLGLALQFGIHLTGFVGQRRRVGGTVAAPAGATPTAGPKRGTPWRHPTRVLPTAVAAIAVVALAFTLRAPPDAGDFATDGFGRLPVLANGRVKPLDTVARTSLLLLQGRQKVTTTEGVRLTPVEWLLDMLYRPRAADQYPVLEITHPDVLGLLSLSAAEGAGKKRFALAQFGGRLGELDRQAKLAERTEHKLRTPFQRAVVQLRNNVALYQRLQGSLVAFGTDDFLEQLAQFETTLAPGHAASLPAATNQPAATAPADLRMEMARVFSTMNTFSHFRPVPPPLGGDPADWKTIGNAWTESFANGRAEPAARAFAELGRAWRGRRPEAFNAGVREYRGWLESSAGQIQTKADAEARFNAAQPFHTSTILYLGAFLLAVGSWLKWPEPLRRAAFALVVIGFILTTAGIATRMWLEARPPVTNLYSSALFVGWGAVALCVVLEATYRNAVGSAAAGLIGFATLLIAHHLALGGDTMEMMRAVLDSNFWLATHVVVVTAGYSATFLAGFLGILHILRACFARAFDDAEAATLGRMMYGVVCFATLFSFVGTILGGIWADQSWGRFWGWDPKENGALLIVIWNAIFLHVRWAGLARGRGLAALAVGGNIVTAWSWFGVNMLGVGLHSYGFMDAAFWWLVGFAASQLLIIALAALPPARRRNPPTAAAEA